VKKVARSGYKKGYPKAKKISAAQKRLAEGNGDYLSSVERSQLIRQHNCNHRKGGYFEISPIPGEPIKSIRVDGTHIWESTSSGKYTVSFPSRGESQYYAVIKHVMANGDMWVRCQRCMKWWKPPLRSQYPTDFDFYTAVKEYADACNFLTNNSTSGSVRFRFPNDERVRKTLMYS
jgi:hypothetical protein